MTGVCSECICSRCFKRWKNGTCADDERGCRNGIFFPMDSCEEFVEFKGVKVRECLKANIMEYQDGTIACSLVDNYGCERCMNEFKERLKKRHGR